MVSPVLKRKSVVFVLTLLVFVPLLFITAYGTERQNNNEETDDLREIEELLAVDEEEEAVEGGSFGTSSHADVSSGGQRVLLDIKNENAEEIARSNEFVLVLGYAPWCGRSAELMPHFSEAAMRLKALGSSVLMAKLDAERYSKAAAYLSIKGFPTVLFLVNGSSHVYTGGFSWEEIVVWTKKKTGAPVMRINTETEARKCLKDHSRFVIGVFERFEGKEYEEFVRAAERENSTQFVEAMDSVVARVLYPPSPTVFSFPFLGLVKNEPENYVAHAGDFRAADILRFVDRDRFPLVTLLTELNPASVHGRGVALHLTVFASSDAFERLRGPLQDIARKFREKIAFLHADTASENLVKPLLAMFGTEGADGTVVTAFDTASGLKYLLESEATPANLEGFCRRLAGDGGTPPRPFYRSETEVAVQESGRGGVRVVVGKNFEDVVLGSAESVVLEVRVPWCLHCEAATKVVDSLAVLFRHHHDVIFARVDASVNEHPLLEVSEYPMILLYPSGRKLKPLKLPVSLNVKDLVEVIKRNTGGGRRHHHRDHHHDHDAGEL